MTDNYKMDVYLDFDDSIVNSSSMIAAYYNNKYKSHPDFKPAIGSKIYYYDGRNQMPLANKQDILDVFNSDFFFENCEFIPYAYNVIEKLNNSNKFNLHIVSIGTKENITKKRRWINENIPFIKNDNIILIERADCAMGKSQYLPKHSEYIIIDDHEENLKNNSKFKILFTPFGERDYNKNFEGIRLNNWLDFELYCLSCYRVTLRRKNKIINEVTNNEND